MRGEASSDVLKIWLYAAASAFLGAWSTPFFYNAGKALADVAATKETNGPLDALANICRDAAFPAFFTASLVIAAILLFFPFMSWLRTGRAGEDGEKAWKFRLPEGARGQMSGQRLRANPHGMRQLVLGFILAIILFFFIGGVLMLAGGFQWRAPQERWVAILLRATFVAFGLAVLQEVLFRGIAMGVFLRAMRPAMALGMSAVFFALVHFLHPPAGLNVPDPDASGTGFTMLKQLASQFGEPRAVFGAFAPMLALGGTLAYARWRTASLCLPIGLHAGWLFVNSILGSITISSSHPKSVMWVISGPSTGGGLVPLLGILITGFLANQWLTRGDDDASEPA